MSSTYIATDEDFKYDGNLLLISNPVCGDGNAHDFVLKHVVPLLSQYNVPIARTIVTDAPGSAGKEVLGYLHEHSGVTSIILVLSSGDGTLYEIVNTLFNSRSKLLERTIKIRVVLVPSGTANALYSSMFPLERDGLRNLSAEEYKLLSLRSFLERSHRETKLNVMKSTIRPSKDSDETTHYGFVVTSTCLHAAILHDSEELRKTMPNLDRFKVAARHNIANWYYGDTIFRPAAAASGVNIYDRALGKFVRYTGDDLKCGRPSMNGPFAYFLSTVNTDRLEPSYVISPLRSIIPPEPGTIDVIIVRPLRNSTLPKDRDEGPKAFAENLGTILMAPYRGGAHIKLAYLEDGTLTEGDVGMNAVEIVRCGGWEWIHRDERGTAQHICLDGTVLSIGLGGTAICTVEEESNVSFLLYT